MMKKQNGLDAKAFNKALYAFVFFTIGATVLASIYFVFILNRMSQDLSNSKYIASNNNEKIEALTKLKDDYENVAYEREKLEAYIPEEKEASDVVKDLETMAQRNALSFAAYQVDSAKSKKETDAKSSADDPQVKKGDDYYTFTFKAELSGSYMMVDKMISEIEEHDRLMEIKKILYTPQSKDDSSSGGDEIKAALLINTYLRK